MNSIPGHLKKALNIFNHTLWIRGLHTVVNRHSEMKWSTNSIRVNQQRKIRSTVKLWWWIKWRSNDVQTGSKYLQVKLEIWSMDESGNTARDLGSVYYDNSLQYHEVGDGCNCLFFSPSKQEEHRRIKHPCNQIQIQANCKVDIIGIPMADSDMFALWTSAHLWGVQYQQFLPQMVNVTSAELVDINNLWPHSYVAHLALACSCIAL